jgi:hypothetical protein
MAPSSAIGCDGRGGMAPSREIAESVVSGKRIRILLTEITGKADAIANSQVDFRKFIGFS